MTLPLFKPETDWVVPSELPDLTNRPIIGMDTETRDDGIKNNLGAGWPLGLCNLRGISVSDGITDWYLPADHFDNMGRWLETLYKRTSIVFFNGPYDLGVLDSTYSVGTPDRFHDAQLGVFHLDENRLNYDLDSCAKDYGIQGKDKTLLREAAASYDITGKKQFSDRDMIGNIWKLPHEYVGPYAEADARSTLLLWQAIHPLLVEQGVWKAYELDRDILPMCNAMRARGVAINIDGLHKAQASLLAGADRALAMVGHQLGLRRSLDISEARSARLLKPYFDREGVPYNKTPKTKQPEFKSEWMRDHEHWLPSGIAKAKLMYDTAEKFLGNYLYNYTHNGRIHAEIVSYRDSSGGTRSHRFAYRNPPLQQMPSIVPEIRDAVRGVFLPDEGQDWLAADYSQQEPRLTVHYAAEAKVRGWQEAIEYYTHGDGDYHTMVATMTGLPRKRAKIINLGLAYGMGRDLLAASLGVSVEEAKQILAHYHDAVPFVQLLSYQCSRMASNRGYIKLIDGARCRFDMWELDDWESRVPPAPREKLLEEHPGKRIRRAFTHKAMNRLIQGGAARQTKMAMRECWREGFLPYLQMHDELDFPVATPKDCETIGNIMKDVCPLRVPVAVDLEVGPTWGSANTSYKEYYNV